MSENSNSIDLNSDAVSVELNEEFTGAGVDQSPNSTLIMENSGDSGRVSDPPLNEPRVLGQGEELSNGGSEGPGEDIDVEGSNLEGQNIGVEQEIAMNNADVLAEMEVDQAEVNAFSLSVGGETESASGGQGIAVNDAEVVDQAENNAVSMGDETENEVPQVLDETCSGDASMMSLRSEVGENELLVETDERQAKTVKYYNVEGLNLVVDLSGAFGTGNNHLLRNTPNTEHFNPHGFHLVEDMNRRHRDGQEMPSNMKGINLMVEMNAGDGHDTRRPFLAACGSHANLAMDLNRDCGASGEQLPGKRSDNSSFQVKEVLRETNVSPCKGGVKFVASGNQGMGPNDEDAIDCKVVVLRPKVRGDDFQTEKDGEFYLSDLVWGKVRGHPWWPGQIFEPAAASAKAEKHFKEDSYLLAYFGDSSFAWNEPLKIKPFRLHFSKLEKQRDTESFCRAVDCALEEVSRRVEYGLSCSCFPREHLAKIESQMFISAGIREESSRRYGGDPISGAPTFSPTELLQDLQSLAAAPFHGIDKLRFVTARAQILSFMRFKGFNGLPDIVELHGHVNDDADILKLGNNGLVEAKNYKVKGSSVTKLKRMHSYLSTGVSKESPSISSEEMLSKLRLAASNPTECGFIVPFIHFFSVFRNYVCLQDENVRKRKRSDDRTIESEGIEDSYWTDRVIQSNAEEQVVSLDPENPANKTTPEIAAGLVEPEAKNPAVKVGEDCEEYTPTALILEFNDFESLPSVTDLHNIFSRYGPLDESHTEVSNSAKRARVVFNRRSDAETAFSNAGDVSGTFTSSAAKSV